MTSHGWVTESGRQKLENALVKWNLPKEVAEEISEHRTVVTYAKGAILFLQGAPADLLFWVLSGFVDVYCPVANGNRILVRISGANEVVGHRAVLDEKGRLVQCFEVHARTKCEVALIGREHLNKLLKRLDQNELLAYMATDNASWSKAFMRWTTLMGLDYRQRLELILADLAERFGAQETRGTLLIPELCHEDFAEMIGCSRPMATKLINEMMMKGMIRRCGRRYIIMNRAGVQAFHSEASNGNGNGRHTVTQS